MFILTPLQLLKLLQGLPSRVKRLEQRMDGSNPTPTPSTSLENQLDEISADVQKTLQGIGVLKGQSDEQKALIKELQDELAAQAVTPTVQTKVDSLVALANNMAAGIDAILAPATSTILPDDPAKDPTTAGSIPPPPNDPAPSSSSATSDAPASSAGSSPSASGDTPPTTADATSEVPGASA